MHSTDETEHELAQICNQSKSRQKTTVKNQETIDLEAASSQTFLPCTIRHQQVFILLTLDLVEV